MGQTELKDLIELAKIKMEDPEKYEQIMTTVEDVFVRMSKLVNKL